MSSQHFLSLNYNIQGRNWRWLLLVFLGGEIVCGLLFVWGFVVVVLLCLQNTCCFLNFSSALFKEGKPGCSGINMFVSIF